MSKNVFEMINADMLAALKGGMREGTTDLDAAFILGKVLSLYDLNLEIRDLLAQAPTEKEREAEEKGGAGEEVAPQVN